MGYSLGIDIGASKTELALGAEDGTIISRTDCGSCALWVVSDEQAQGSLRQAIAGLIQPRSLALDDLERVCVGTAGYSRTPERLRLAALMRTLVPCEISLVSDMQIALEAAFPREPGLVVMAGTGSFAYGRNARGETTRVGGWGATVSDEGSAAWIGKQAVRTTLRALDTGQSTTLVGAILNEWKLGTREDVADHANRCSQSDFARLFPLVCSEAEAGDIIASECLTGAATELALLAKIALRKLWPGRDSVNIAIGGGVFRHSGFMRQVFQNSVRAERQAAKFVPDLIDPVAGALHLTRNPTTATVQG